VVATSVSVKRRRGGGSDPPPFDDYYTRGIPKKKYLSDRPFSASPLGFVLTPVAPTIFDEARIAKFLPSEIFYPLSLRE